MYYFSLEDYISACNQFVSIHAWPFPEVNMLYDATFSKLQRSLAKSAYGSVDHKDIYLVRTKRNMASNFVFEFACV